MRKSEPPIGGEMELDPELLLGPRRAPPPLAASGWTRVSTGRTALRLIARGIKGRSRGGVLLPSYLCASVLQPFREEGLGVDFYRVRSDLSIDLGHLEEQLDRRTPAALLFINYFGFPPLREAREGLERFRSRGLLIEDCSHGSLLEAPSPPVGQLGDFVLTSLRKYLPLPDGGLILNRTSIRLPSLASNAAPWVYRRFMAKALRHAHLQADGAPGRAERAYLELFSQAERTLDGESPLLAMSGMSERLYESLDLGRAARRRRSNFLLLREAFGADRRLRRIGCPLLGALPEGISPLVFPIRVGGGRRNSLRRELARRRVYCPVHWPLPPELQSGGFGDAQSLSHDILGLPVDQRYAARDMNSLIARLAGSWRDVG